MTEPLALVSYQNLIPGSQLPTRLRDSGYRVEIVSDRALLGLRIREQRPLVLLLEITSAEDPGLETLRHLKQDPTCSHLPVLAFCGNEAELGQRVMEAGADLCARSGLLIAQLPALLQRVLELE